MEISKLRIKLEISIIGIFLLLGLNSCKEKIVDNNPEESINRMLDSWHLAATKADTAFFNYLDSNAIYIGTDATERWTKSEFMQFALPYFRKGNAWDFKPIERKVYFCDNKDLAWFNETLNTWMGICRSSGVVTFNDSREWKIIHYHLSCTVPNEKIKDFIELINKSDTLKH